MILARFARICAVFAALAAAAAPARAESITASLTSGYVNSPALMSALLSVKSAAEDVAIRRAGKLPTIGLTGDASSSLVVGGAIPGGFSTSQSMSVSLGYRQTLFDNFKTDLQIEQARAFVELSTYALASQEQNVLLSIVQSYMNVVRDTALVQLRGDSVAFFDAQVSSADERLRIGEGTRIEVSQATARRAQAVASYRAAIASLTSSQASYERWVGRKPRNLTQDFPYSRLLPRSIDEAVQQALSQHPAILSARAAIRASQAGSEMARAAFGPTLDLIGSVCALSCVGGNATGVSASVRLSLSIPIYAGGALGAGARKANLEQIKTEVDALDARDQVRESVVSAWSSVQNSTAQIEAAQSAVESGQLVLEGTVQERDVGQRTTLDVLNAQAELTSAREALIQATSSRIVASFALIAATGRLSASELGLDVEIKSGAAYAAKVEDIWQELRAIDE